MASRQASGLRSTAAIAGHPVHPLLVDFPIAVLVGAFLTTWPAVQIERKPQA
jgi:uncharacterized membrane protein